MENTLNPNMLRAAFLFANTKAIRPELRGACLYPDGSICSTDLAAAFFGENCITPGQLAEPVILPVITIPKNIVEMKLETNGLTHIHMTNNKGVKTATKIDLIDGIHPNLDQYKYTDKCTIPEVTSASMDPKYIALIAKAFPKSRGITIIPFYHKDKDRTAYRVVSIEPEKEPGELLIMPIVTKDKRELREFKPGLSLLWKWTHMP